MDSSHWANLPKDLLDSVLERLPTRLDYLRFSEVCMSWNSVAKDAKRKYVMTTPVLLTYSGKEDTWNLCDITRDKVLDFQLDLPNKRFCGFSKGWLITMDENFIVTLINPSFRVKGMRAKENSIIRLPALNLLKNDKGLEAKWAKQCDYYIFKATMSADPISNAKDCIVVVIYEHLCQLAFIRPDKDTEWTYAGIHAHIKDVVYVEDKFYVVDIMNQLFSFDVTTTQLNSQDIEFVAEGFEQDYHAINGYLADVKRYLVESSDRKELLMVHRHMSLKFLRRGHRWKRVTTKFEVFIFDAYTHSWIEISSLGGVALFVGDNSSIYVLASNFLRCLPNCIYFVHDWDRGPRNYGHRAPRDFGVYNMKNKSFSTIPRHASTLMKMSNRTPIWTMANIGL